jgi:riboflavin kinase
MKNLTFCGVVTSGKGEGKKYLALPWVKSQIEEKLGFIAYEGTLNLKLSQKGAKLRSELKGVERLKICPLEGYCVGAAFKSKIGTLECGIIIPSLESYPKNVLEVVAHEKLREKLHLKDGDKINVTVSF